MKNVSKPSKRNSRKLLSPLFASLTLGLAPFYPEPHIIGKIRWLMGGGEGMAAMDYFDVLLHGAPWVWLIISFVQFIRTKV
ncbi:MAG: hypothetical protein P8X57_12605 [Cyclobacteriaceae bacterium]